MNAIPNSSPENAIINANGSNPNIKKMNPELIILYVNPLKMFKSICPDNMLAANLSPKDTFLAK